MLDQVFNSPFNIGIETLLQLIVLVAMEAVLTADNAIALAGLAQTLQQPELERRALNIGLGLAYVFRMLLVVGTAWVLQFWQFELAGALYLLWLAGRYFTTKPPDSSQLVQASSHWQIIPLMVLTDLAFSLDSVTTALAISQELWLIMLGGTIGVVLLRFLAGLFIQWLQEFVYLEDAGYWAVALVGMRLLLRVVNPEWVPPEWAMISLIAVLFIWGFSRRTSEIPVESQSSSVDKMSYELVE
ncbi:DUF475 domain-containing protein [Leptolyngbyaceae cyanobacterium CCMR0082]|uniref:DUF475 domain-containing protein n=2 Tax=Adonisia turfae TaxID=2950184 RepID=A0A6M0S1J7_9CYAN|nr:DUF475 domain-containing protein [Adonisia turfae]MDV3353730.1 DUF475 domain-containing protein [Leptothoe sp. LEGE 181152]NEZ61003.1 DUF475 domain-containing protein [Adonisia turfae CCMR0081]NEZ61831.1 DUF475 domain-containing protein [Adonisia turfae CCMR0082]